jgi:hypothetical protein
MLPDWLVPADTTVSPPANKPNIWPPGKNVPWRNAFPTAPTQSDERIPPRYGAGSNAGWQVCV